VFVTLFVLNTSPDYPSGLNDGHPRGGKTPLGATGTSTAAS